MSWVRGRGARDVTGDICGVPVERDPGSRPRALSWPIGKSLGVFSRWAAPTEVHLWKQHQDYHMESGLVWGRYGGSCNTQGKNATMGNGREDGKNRFYLRKKTDLFLMKCFMRNHQQTYLYQICLSLLCPLLVDKANAMIQITCKLF